MLAADLFCVFNFINPHNYNNMRTIRTQRFVRGVPHPSTGSTNDTDTVINSTNLPPFISEVCGSVIPTNTRSRITIKGFHFTANANITIRRSSGSTGTGLVGIQVTRIEFVNPSELSVIIDSGSEQGTFDIVVANGNLNSESSGNSTLQIKNPTWVDFRNTNPTNVALEFTRGLSIGTTSNLGLTAVNSNSSFGVVKFSGDIWKRCDTLNFSVVFTITSLDSSSLIGIGGADIDPENLGPEPFHEAEAQLLIENGKVNFMYGGGNRYRKWIQDIGGEVALEIGKFYKFSYFITSSRRPLTLAEVDPNNFDQTTLVSKQYRYTSFSIFFVVYGFFRSCKCD